MASHSNCNSSFDLHVERPARTAVASMVSGGRITSAQLDAVLDWLDKVRSSVALMANAFNGHQLTLGYKEIAFPNWRVGVFDRVAMFFRVDRFDTPLDLWDCMGEGFQTTPGALILRIKDLIIITVSNNCLLSKAFGLDDPVVVDGEVSWARGTNVFSAGFGSRKTRLGVATIVAQAMRREHMGAGMTPSNKLMPSGDGRIFSLSKDRWSPTKSIDFGRLPVLSSQVGFSLATLEIIEWLLLQKEQDFARRGSPTEFFANRSVPELRNAKISMIEIVSAARGGLRPSYSDRL